MNTNNYKKYIGTDIIQGITDLKNIHPWIASSQGDHSYADKIENSNEWLMFSFNGILKTNAVAIKDEIKNR
jgi:hypothetical protein